MKQPSVILCADDFGFAPRTSAIIADLARQRCINAISCMAAAEGWRDHAPLLGRLAQENGVQIGLHLVLASEPPLGAVSCIDAQGRMPDPDRLLMMALRGAVPLGEFAVEIDRQFSAFAAATGHPPHFVDAHQHVHVYPGIRRLVVAATRHHAPQAWVRVPGDSLPAMLARPFAGKAIGSRLHRLGFRRLLDQAGLRSNHSFAGHYDFGPGFNTVLPAFFRHRSSFHVVMCHPGAAERADDSIGPAREIEAEVLAQMPLADRIRHYDEAQRG